MSDESENGTASAPRPPFIRRVKIRNYKSIASCDVELGAFTLLVGRNGSGKSNFLDALAFVSDALQTSLRRAVNIRNGIGSVKNRLLMDQKSTQTSIAVTMQLGELNTIDYAFQISETNSEGDWILESEQLTSPHGDFLVEKGVVKLFEPKDAATSLMYEGIPPPVTIPNSLYLVMIANLPAFKESYECLQSISVYNFDVATLRQPQNRDTGNSLAKNGSNLPAVVRRLIAKHPGMVSRICQYMSAVAPGIINVTYDKLGQWETISFVQQFDQSTVSHSLYAQNISDGTLRAFATLVAANLPGLDDLPVHLVGIEEPETALHPGAAGALMDALHEAACRTQIIVTTHSPDLLDRVDFSTDKVLAVQMRDGATEIGPIDEASRSVIEDGLYTPGELLRMNQLQPQIADEVKP